jgi:Flp pilus assembly protein TadB
MSRRLGEHGNEPEEVAMAHSDLATASTADLVKLATEQIRDLVREEVNLAKAEMAEKGKQVGTGAGMFGVAAGLAFFGTGVLLAAATLALALVLPAWAAALIVAGVLFVCAVVLVVLGRSHVRRSVPAAPQDTIKSVRADLSAVSAAVRSRRHA